MGKRLLVQDIGVRRRQQDAAGYRAGVGTVEGAVFALLGLLIADATGRSYEDAVTELLLRPLGISGMRRVSPSRVSTNSTTLGWRMGSVVATSS